jgi:hypothetical protein
LFTTSSLPKGRKKEKSVSRKDAKKRKARQEKLFGQFFAIFALLGVFA